MTEGQTLNSSTFLHLLDHMPVGTPVAIDTETNGYDIRSGEGYAIGVSMSFRAPALGLVRHYFPLRHNSIAGGDYEKTVQYELKRIIEKQTCVIFHNAKFDLVSLATLGIYYTGKFYCTMLMAHLINENLPYNKSLDSCGKYYLNDPGKKVTEPGFALWIKKIGWTNPMPPSLMRAYAEYDADLTYRLWELLVTHISWDEDLEEYWCIQKMPYVRLIAKMEGRGVRIDVDLCNKMAALGNLQMEEITEILGLNPGSSKDQKELFLNRLKLPEVYKKRKNGMSTVSFDKDTMELYDQILERRQDPTAELVLTYRGWQKSVSSNYRPYVELLSQDGRLRPNYKLHGTKTGRSSCEKPNLQQIPKVSNKPWNGEMKACFIPEDGFELWEADYSQLELRLGSAYGHETELLRAFEEGRDVFTEMSQELKMTRFDTKTLVYSVQYSAGKTRISNVFGVSMDRAAEIIENFHMRYPGFRSVAKMASSKVKRNGKVKLWSKRYRHFQWPESENHKAFNSVMQGGAADIMERAMLRLERSIDSDDCRMLLMVHDSVVFEIRKGREGEFIPRIKRVMEAVEPDFGVKFNVEVKRWGE